MTISSVVSGRTARWRMLLDDYGYEPHTPSRSPISTSQVVVGARRPESGRKPDELLIHRHPLGQPNSTREPAAPLRQPEAWIYRLEEEIATHYGF